MIKLAGCGDNIEDNKKRILDCLECGDAYMKFL
jgi:hypothetical protein